MKLKSLMTSAAILGMVASSAAYAAGPTEVVVEDDPYALAAPASSSSDAGTIAAIVNKRTPCFWAFTAHSWQSVAVNCGCPAM